MCNKVLVRIPCYFLVFIIFSFTLNAQVNSPVKIDVFPPSPNAQALGKFADLPVSLYTGTPQINIPIYEINEGEVTLPISLSYHAGGIRVQEIASWVGLGWALNAGGVITRTVRGLPDELSTTGWLHSDPILPAFIPSPSWNEKIDSYINGGTDSQPDLFYFNFNGKSGKFVFDQESNIYLAPFQKLKILFDNDFYLKTFTIIDEQGVVYIFGGNEINSPIERSQFNTHCDDVFTASDSPLISSWFISKIITPSKDTIGFEYEKYSLSEYNVSITQTEYNRTFTTGGSSMFKNSKCITKIDPVGSEFVRLKTIKFKKGEINFVPSNTQRCDLIKDRMLQEVIIKNSLGAIIKSYKLDYVYMNENGFYPVGSPCNSDPEVSRLILKSIEETSKSGIMIKPKHYFFYKTGLPPRFSYAIDLWGFYNGIRENKTFIPELFDYENNYFPGADRQSNENATAGVLSSIKYPTGGVTKFNYEPHQSNAGSKIYRPREETITPIIKGSKTIYRDSIKYFVVNNAPTVKTIIDINLETWPCIPNSCVYNVSIYDSLTDGFIFSTHHINSINSNGPEHQLQLPNGIYKLQLHMPEANDVDTLKTIGFTYRMKWNEATRMDNFYAGGIRISSMEDIDSINNKKTIKTYDYANDFGLSEGRLVTKPLLNYKVEEDMGWNYYNIFQVRTTIPTTPLGLTQGSTVGYIKVTVKDSSLNNSQINCGKSVYWYSNPASHSDKTIAVGFPFAPTDSREWMRGLLLQSINYRKEGNEYIPVKKIVNNYNFYDNKDENSNVKVVKGLKAGYYVKSYNAGHANIHTNGGRYAVHYFDFTTGYHELAVTTETTYDKDTNNKYYTQTYNSYKPSHLQLTNKTTFASNGDALVQSFSYPDDYSNTDGFIGTLKAANIINFPIEKVNYRIKSGTQQAVLISGETTTSKFPSSIPGLKDKVYFLESSQERSLATFKFSNSTIPGEHNGPPAPFLLDTAYRLRFNYSKYDEQGNLLEYQEEKDVPTSIIWGYNKTLPIAEIKNASYNNVAYTGFENDNEGRFSYSPVFAYEAKSGKRSFKGTSIVCSNLEGPSKKYIISFWAKNPGAADVGVIINSLVINVPANTGWKHYKQSVFLDNSVSIESNVNILMDDLRLYPEGAQMTTYTYDQLVGMTSVTAPNGISTSYEYDGLQRLKLIKDNKKNILKSHIYHYSGQ